MIPADDRDVWRNVGFALHDLARGDPRWAGPVRALWDDWSKTSEKFNEKDQEKTWASFDRGYDGRRVTVGTLYQLAQSNGWVAPVSLASTLRSEQAARGGAAGEEPERTPEVQPKSGVNFAAYRRTDAGNADMFCALFGDNVRYAEKWGLWLVWDGSGWVETSNLAMLGLAKKATEEILKWAARLPSDGDREAWIKHALTTEKEHRLRSMLTIASASLIIEPNALDADSWLLGCPNGTLDLRTGKLRGARREDFVTKRVAVPFDPPAACSRWRAFLDWAMQGDSEAVEFLQTLAGYALTGEIREEILCALVGDGANGKSTFLMTLFVLWGDYAGKARSDLLVHAQGKEGAPSPDVAALHGKRLVIVSETEEGCMLSEARIKDIVSNETIAARRLHHDPFTFRPTHKIILGTNYQPHVRGMDSGIWRRLAIVPFNATIEEEQKVADFRERVLRQELAGILNWAVAGLMKWQRDGLRLPAPVREATAEYRSAMDTVAQWIEERTDADPASLVTARLLHVDYVSWLGPHARPFGVRRFSEELERKGFPACKLADGVRARRGLRLKSIGLTARLQVVR